MTGIIPQLRRYSLPWLLADSNGSHGGLLLRDMKDGAATFMNNPG